MDSSLQDSSFLHLDNDYQILIMLRNAICSAFTTSVSITMTALHYFFLPAVLMYSFWAYAIEQSWQITKHIASEIYSLMQIIPLGVEAWCWAALCVLQFLFLFKRMEEIAITVEQKIYKVLKLILHKLNALPLSHKHAAGLFSILKKLPIFGKSRLPFPHFLFEDTFTNISFRREIISISIPPPADFPQTKTAIVDTQTTGGGETPTSVQTPATGSNSIADQPASTSIPVINEPIPTSSTLKKKSSKSDEKPAKPVELSIDQSPSTSEVKTSGSI